MTRQIEQSPLNRQHIFALAFFSLILFLVFQVARILEPFLSGLLWAAILALALNPLYRRLLAAMRHRAVLAAGIMTLLVLLLIIVPMIVVLTMLASQAVDLYAWISTLMDSGRLTDLWGSFSTPLIDKIGALPFLRGIDIKGIVLNGISEASSGMASSLGGLLKNTLLIAVNLLVMIVMLFLFFLKGEGYFQSLMELLPFRPEQKESIVRKFGDTFSAVIAGIILIALLQGLMTTIGFMIFGIPFALLWGVIAAVCALLPIGGAALVWLPGAAYLYFNGALLQSVLLSIWGIVLISLPDNILKPMIIGKRANIQPFILFFAILGGLQAYGFLGILFGPLIVTLLFAFVQIYREEYTDH